MGWGNNEPGDKAWCLEPNGVVHHRLTRTQILHNTHNDNEMINNETISSEDDDDDIKRGFTP